MRGLMGYFWVDGLFSCHASPTRLKMRAMPTTVLPIMLGSYTQLYTARPSCLCCIFIGGGGRRCLGLHWPRADPSHEVWLRILGLKSVQLTSPHVWSTQIYSGIFFIARTIVIILAIKQYLCNKNYSILYDDLTVVLPSVHGSGEYS